MAIDGGGPTPGERGIPQQGEGSRSLWGRLTGKDTGRGKGRSLWKQVEERRAASEKGEPQKSTDVTGDIEKVRYELAGAGREAKGSTLPKDVVEELMPKVREILTKEGPADETKMLKLMDELEESEGLKGNVQTIGQGKDRALILSRIVQTTAESTSYGDAVNPRELIPMGKLTTAQSEWLVVNRKGFIKYAVIDQQQLAIDETSAYFDGRRFPDSHSRNWEGPVHPEKHWIDQIRRWADGVERSIKYNGDELRDMMRELLFQKDYPQNPAKNPFDRFPMGQRPPQDEVDKYYHEKNMASFGHYLHPESGWSTLLSTEKQRKASSAIRRGANPAGFQYNQYHHDFFRVVDPDFIQQALTVNKVMPAKN